VAGLLFTQRTSLLFEDEGGAKKSRVEAKSGEGRGKERLPLRREEGKYYTRSGLPQKRLRKQKKIGGRGRRRKEFEKESVETKAVRPETAAQTPY